MEGSSEHILCVGEDDTVTEIHISDCSFDSFLKKLDTLNLSKLQTISLQRITLLHPCSKVLPIELPSLKSFQCSILNNLDFDQSSNADALSQFLFFQDFATSNKPNTTKPIPNYIKIEIADKLVFELDLINAPGYLLCGLDNCDIILEKYAKFVTHMHLPSSSESIFNPIKTCAAENFGKLSYLSITSGKWDMAESWLKKLNTLMGLSFNTFETNVKITALPPNLKHVVFTGAIMDISWNAIVQPTISEYRLDTVAFNNCTLTPNFVHSFPTLKPFRGVNKIFLQKCRNSLNYRFFENVVSKLKPKLFCSDTDSINFETSDSVCPELKEMWDCLTSLNVTSNWSADTGIIIGCDDDTSTSHPVLKYRPLFYQEIYDKSNKFLYFDQSSRFGQKESVFESNITFTSGKSSGLNTLEIYFKPLTPFSKGSTIQHIKEQISNNKHIDATNVERLIQRNSTVLGEEFPEYFELFEHLTELELDNVTCLWQVDKTGIDLICDESFVPRSFGPIQIGAMRNIKLLKIRRTWITSNNNNLVPTPNEFQVVILDSIKKPTTPVFCTGITSAAVAVRGGGLSLTEYPITANYLHSILSSSTRIILVLVSGFKWDRSTTEHEPTIAKIFENSNIKPVLSDSFCLFKKEESEQWNVQYMNEYQVNPFFSREKGLTLKEIIQCSQFAPCLSENITSFSNQFDNMTQILIQDASVLLSKFISTLTLSNLNNLQTLKLTNVEIITSPDLLTSLGTTANPTKISTPSLTTFVLTFVLKLQNMKRVHKKIHYFNDLKPFLFFSANTNSSDVMTPESLALSGIHIFIQKDGQTILQIEDDCFSTSLANYHDFTKSKNFKSVTLSGPFEIWPSNLPLKDLTLLDINCETEFSILQQYLHSETASLEKLYYRRRIYNFDVFKEKETVVLLQLPKNLKVLEFVNVRLDLNLANAVDLELLTFTGCDFVDKQIVKGFCRFFNSKAIQFNHGYSLDLEFLLNLTSNTKVETIYVEKLYPIVFGSDKEAVLNTIVTKLAQFFENVDFANKKDQVLNKVKCVKGENGSWTINCG